MIRDFLCWIGWHRTRGAVLCVEIPTNRYVVRCRNCGRRVYL